MYSTLTEFETLGPCTAAPPRRLQLDRELLVTDAGAGAGVSRIVRGVLGLLGAAAGTRDEVPRCNVFEMFSM